MIKEKDRKEDISTELESKEYLVESKKIKKVSVIIDSDINIYHKKKLNLQIIALVMIIIIFIISPLRLLDSQTAIDFTAIGFIVASLIPSLIAIFGFLQGRRVCLILTTLIYGVWIVALATFYLEAVLLIVVLILYFEIIKTLILIEPLLKDVISIKEGGAYYHASVLIERYLTFLLRFGGLLFASSLTLSVIGWYVIDLMQSDILFSIFMIIGFITLIILSQKTLTPDLKRILIEERKERYERELAESHSKFS